ncbi:MAG: DUF3105 domain-containing protein [Myxococcota bacterium]
MVLALVACGGPVALPSDSGVTPTGDPGDDTVPLLVSSTPCDACDGDCVIEELAYAARYHTVEPVAYQDRPPAGGPHDPCWSTWGTHAEPVPDDRWVHNLEHGGVVSLYHCDDCVDEVAAMASLATSQGLFTLVTPYAEMDDRFAAVAWGWRLRASCFDEPTFAAFYADHVDQGPESLPGDPSADCM